MAYIHLQVNKYITFIVSNAHNTRWLMSCNTCSDTLRLDKQKIYSMWSPLLSIHYAYLIAKLPWQYCYSHEIVILSHWEKGKTSLHLCHLNFYIFKCFPALHYSSSLFFISSTTMKIHKNASLFWPIYSWSVVNNLMKYSMLNHCVLTSLSSQREISFLHSQGIAYF